ncbi:MAG: OB-fold domain-containing protein [Anaerolineales bacterium]|nr:OB-fold domain-containing protein [Anaerolineales bacterium]
MAKLPSQRVESLGGFVVHGIPFPANTDEESLQFLKKMAPIQIEQEYKIMYLHSYGQDSPWFAGLTNKRLLASRDAKSGYTYANPRGHDVYSGDATNWIDITNVPAKIHAFTVCYFGSEEFLPDCPFVLALIEFEGVNTLLLTRIMGVDPAAPALDWIGMEVQPRFLRNSKLKPTDVYFVPKGSE